MMRGCVGRGEEGVCVSGSHISHAASLQMGDLFHVSLTGQLASHHAACRWYPFTRLQICRSGAAGVLKV